MPRTIPRLGISALVALMPVMAGCLAEAYVATSDGAPRSVDSDRALAAAPAPAPDWRPEPLQPVAAAPAAPLPSPSAIHASGRERISFLNGVIGDVDHDGFDDFVLSAHEASPQSAMFRFVPATVTYLFYGRADFPPQLSTAHADAAFRGNQTGLAPLGDINGDQRDDFAVMTGVGARLVLGQGVRLQGEYPVDALGILWDSGFTVDDATAFISVFDVYGSGDVNGDGFDDLAVHVQIPSDDPTGIAGTNYIVSGRARDLPAGRFDPSWAIAEFEAPPPLDPFRGGVVLTTVPLMPGDFDGDGYGDVLAAYGQTDVSVFYGGPHAFEGMIFSTRAAARLSSRYPEVLMPFVPAGDIDGDGVTDLLAPSEPTGSGPDRGIVYGRTQRWSGWVTLDPDLVILPPKQDSPRYLGVAVGGDVDADGDHDVVVGVSTSEDLTEPSNVYVIRSEAGRLTGVVQLSDANVLQRGTVTERIDRSGAPYWDSDQLGGSLSLGDVNGDGSADVLAGAPGTPSPLNSDDYAGGTVHLIPGAPQTPQ